MSDTKGDIRTITKRIKMNDTIWKGNRQFYKHKNHSFLFTCLN